MNNHSQMQSMSVPPSAHEPSSECPYWLALIGGGCCGTLLMAKSRHLFSSSSQPLKAASLAFLPKTPAAAAQSRPANANNPLAFLDIFRFVALCWVVINHLGSEGRLDILRRQPSGDRFKQAVHDHPIFGALLGNSALGVEIFLLISGLLAARSWHRHQRPEAPFWRNAGTFLFRRWLRLAPPVMAFVLLATSPLLKWAMPQFHLSMASNCNCGQLLSYPLMVNNWAREPTCLGWLWYLGLDWQCYLAAPFLLHAIAKLRRPMALMLVGTLALGSMLLRGWHCSQHGICNKSDVDIPFVHFPGAPADPAQRAMFASLFSLYARPATKCGPFLIGLLLDWLSLQKEQLPKWSPIARRRLFLGGLAMAVAVVYGILPEYWHPEQGNTLYNTLYTATFRTLFAGAIGLMILSRLGLQPEESAPVSPVWAFLPKTPAAAAQSRPANANNPLAFLDIFRFVALCWVVINHLGSEGRLDILRRQPSGDRFKQAVHDHPIFGALLGNSALGVEIFLLISGLLAARSWHRHQRPEAPFWRNAGTFLFRRWLRLAPPVMAFVLLATSPLLKWAMPQFHLSMASNCNCGQLLSYPLMVNNWAREPTCLGWLWYLGLDWQCYLAAPFLLHAIAKLRRPMALMLVGTLALGSMLLRGWHCSQHGICNKSDVDIPFVHFPGAPADPAQRAMFASLFSLYARPATKCGPFLIGLLLDWLSLQKEQLPKWSPIARRRLFLGGLAMAVAVVYGILPEYWHPEQGNTLYNTLYTATFRTLFAGAIGLMILSRLGLQPEESAPVSPVWALLARLTFSAFLLHMPVVFLFNHVDAYQRAVSVYGLLAALPAALGLSFGAAFLFHTFVEQPLQRLTSRLSGQ